MNSQTTDITHFAGIFHKDVTIKALDTLQGTDIIAYNVTSQKFDNLLGVRSLACKIKVLNGHVLGT